MTADKTATALAEKLGFRITEHGQKAIITEHNYVVVQPTLHEVLLWNLCLELSERLERAEKLLEPRICVTPANELTVEIEAEKEKKA